MSKYITPDYDHPDPINSYLRQIANMLPSYDDPGWKTRLDDLMCDVAFAKQSLEKFIGKRED